MPTLGVDVGAAGGGVVDWALTSDERRDAPKSKTEEKSKTMALRKKKAGWRKREGGVERCN